MHSVYIIKSLSYSNKIYVGYTLDVNERLKMHNGGGSIYTKNYRPWEIIFSCAFQDKLKALEFEKYLKSHAGRIFINKRLV